MDAFQELPLLGPALERFSARFMSTAGLPNVGWVATGLLIVFTILFEPRGLHGLLLRLRAAVGRGRAAAAAVGSRAPGAGGPRRGDS